MPILYCTLIQQSNLEIKFSNTTIQLVPLSRCSINKRSFKNVLVLSLLIGDTTSRRESSANRVFADLFFLQVHVNTTEQIDLQKTYKLGLESYKLFCAPPSSNANLSKLQ